MKEFKKPEVAVVRLPKEDVVTASLCTENICYGYICTDCAECGGSYECLDRFVCTKYVR